VPERQDNLEAVKPQLEGFCRLMHGPCHSNVVNSKSEQFNQVKSPFSIADIIPRSYSLASSRDSRSRISSLATGYRRQTLDLNFTPDSSKDITNQGNRHMGDTRKA
jgi:hypothetical protein